MNFTDDMTAYTLGEMHPKLGKSKYLRDEHSKSLAGT